MKIEVQKVLVETTEDDLVREYHMSEDAAKYVRGLSVIETGYINQLVRAAQIYDLVHGDNHDDQDESN